MVIRINERIVNIIHSYVVLRLVAVEGVMYSGTISGPLERIFNGFGGYCLYSHTLDKAGAVLYSIVHGHSFSDGNKRTGLLTTYFTDFLETMTKTMLEQNALPGIDKNQLVDKTLQRGKIQPAIACG